MADLGFIRGQNGLVPDGQEADEWFAKVPSGARVVASVKVPRNGKFHRKFFAMLKVGYDNWDRPTIMTPMGEAQCSFEAFRSDVTILAGHHEVRVNTRGEARLKAKSIKWHEMDEVEFAALYSAAVNVILERFLTNWKEEDMDRAAENFILGFG